MLDEYSTYLLTLKTYLSHHGRGITFAQAFDPIPNASPLVSFETKAPVSPPHRVAPYDLDGANPPHPEPSHMGISELPTCDNGSMNDQMPPPNYDEPPTMEDEASFGFMDDSPLQAVDDPSRPDVSTLDMTKTSMTDLELFWSGCLACNLGSTRNKMVFGEGAVPARIFFIGEGPGAQEDAQGRPFVGKAGQLLEKMITAMGLSRTQIYIGNIVKCRPPGNRDPEMNEMLACMPVLEKQLELINPEVIVTLGRIAAQALLATTRPLGKLRGKWQSYKKYSLLPTYHPAYLLRNPSAKKMAWEDLQMVMQRLDPPKSE